MTAKNLFFALATGLVVFVVARRVFGPDQYGLDRDSEQSRMLAEQDGAF